MPDPIGIPTRILFRLAAHILHGRAADLREKARPKPLRRGAGAEAEAMHASDPSMGIVGVMMGVCRIKAAPK